MIAIRAIALSLAVLMPVVAHTQLPGLALELSGEDEYFCTNGFLFFLEPPSALTISAWIKIPAGETSGVIVTNGEHGTSAESVSFQVGRFIINSSNSAGTRQSLFYSGLNDDQWHHLACVWDGAEMSAYVDGVLYAGPAPAPLPPWDSGRALIIGGRRSISDPPSNSEFEGLIDELRVWSVARTQAQILSTMFQSLGSEYTAFPDSGLYAYYRFDNPVNLGFKDPGANDIQNLADPFEYGEPFGGQLVSTGVPPTAVLTPASSFSLVAFPNPFSASTQFRFSAGAASHVDFRIYDAAGRLVRSLSAEAREATERTLQWNGRDGRGRPLSNGVYYVQMISDGPKQTQRVLLLR